MSGPTTQSPGEQARRQMISRRLRRTPVRGFSPEASRTIRLRFRLHPLGLHPSPTPPTGKGFYAQARGSAFPGIAPRISSLPELTACSILRTSCGWLTVTDRRLMITFLHGTLIEKQPARVVLEVGGVGYEVFVPLSTFERLPPSGAPCRLLVHDHIREDAHLLFGFATEGEREMFDLLIGINGIGPRTALSALSGLSVQELRRAIAEGDVKRLTTVSGIGRKLAERMVVELRDRLGPPEASAAAVSPTDDQLRLRDAILALMALGYKEGEARRMVQHAVAGAPTDSLDLKEVIRRALAR